MKACPKCGSDLADSECCTKCGVSGTPSLLERITKQTDLISEAYRLLASSPEWKPEPVPIRKAVDIVEKYIHLAFVEREEVDTGVVSIVNDYFVFLFGEAKGSEVFPRWQREWRPSDDPGRARAVKDVVMARGNDSPIALRAKPNVIGLHAARRS